VSSSNRAPSASGRTPDSGISPFVRHPGQRTLNVTTPTISLRVITSRSRSEDFSAPSPTRRSGDPDVPARSMRSIRQLPARACTPRYAGQLDVKIARTALGTGPVTSAATFLNPDQWNLRLTAGSRKRRRPLDAVVNAARRDRAVRAPSTTIGQTKLSPSSGGTVQRTGQQPLYGATRPPTPRT